MRKGTVVLLLVFMALGCHKDSDIKTPKKPIERSVMINIYYDLALLEASRYQNYSKEGFKKIPPKEFIYKKYKIDSAQFSQNNLFYASSIEDYRLMFEEVQKRMQTKSDLLDTIVKKRQEKLRKKSRRRGSNKADTLTQ